MKVTIISTFSAGGRTVEYRDEHHVFEDNWDVEARSISDKSGMPLAMVRNALTHCLERQHVDRV